MSAQISEIEIYRTGEIIPKLSEGADNNWGRQDFCLFLFERTNPLKADQTLQHVGPLSQPFTVHGLNSGP